MRSPHRITRRHAVQVAAAAATLPLVHIRTSGAAGKLTCAFEDHWVPAGSAKTREQVQAWAESNKVEVTIDFITSVGNKIQMTMAAEAQAGAGHDVMAFDMWNVQNHASKLEPVDDVVNDLIAKNGPVSDGVRYLGMTDGRWMAVPGTNGHALLVPCARISMMKTYAGIDVQAMYPAHQAGTPEAENWTYDTFLKAAEACHKAGYAFALGMGNTTDSVQTWGTIFAAFGAQLVDAKGNITVDSDGVRAALDYAKRLIPFLPADSVSYDDASNNRALISGKSAMIWNPPSAWAVAKRDAPQVASDCWTFPNPAGPNGRFVPDRPYFWGVWRFSGNKSAGKELIHYMLERPQAEARDNAVSGYDIPPYAGMTDFKIWEEVEPPKGTVFNYPVRPWHGSTAWIAGAPAPQSIAVQMYNRGIMPGMAAKIASGQSAQQAMDWAKEELEGFTR